METKSVSGSDTPRERVWEAHNHAAHMSHSAQVQLEPPGARECDIRRLSGALSADLTFAEIAGSMDDHEADDGEVFER